MLGLPERNRAVAPSETLPTIRAIETSSSRPSSRPRNRGRIPPNTAGSAGRAAGVAEALMRRSVGAGLTAAVAPAGTGPGPTWRTSPKPSGATLFTRLPLTNVPLVLSRSSTYQARPRNVSTAWSDEAKGSSTMIELLTSRPRVVMASSGRSVPTSGSPEGEAMTTRRPSSMPGSRAADRRSRRRVRATANRKT